MGSTTANSAPHRKNSFRFVGLSSPRWKSSYSFEANSPSTSTSTTDETECYNWKYSTMDAAPNRNQGNYYDQNQERNQATTCASDKTFLNWSFMSRIFRMSRKRSFKCKKGNKVKSNLEFCS